MNAREKLKALAAHTSPYGIKEQLTQKEARSLLAHIERLEEMEGSRASCCARMEQALTALYHVSLSMRILISGQPEWRYEFWDDALKATRQALGWQS
jgi:dTDP-4-amino-4,6-dideoxygalactose transaminase